MGKISMEEVVAKIDELPAIPALVMRALELIDDPRSHVNQLAEVLSSDQALTAKILRLANSAYYSFPRKVATITDAIVILGFSTLKSLIIAASTYNLLNREVEGYGLAQGELWKHSISCAMTARLLAKRIRFRSPETAFVAGLLHDIGKVVLNAYMKEEFEEILKYVETEQVPFMKAEKEILGFDHAEIGAKVAEKWNFPEELVRAIRYHHEPLAVENKTGKANLVDITHLSDAIVLMMGFGLGVDGLMYPIEEAIVERAGISMDDLNEIGNKLIESFADTELLLAS